MLTLLAGALAAFAFAPVALPGLAIISIAWFFYHAKKITTASRAFLLGWLYGVGFFMAGASWIYVSIHLYGHADPWLAAILTVLFALAMGLFYGVFAASFFVLFKKQRLLRQSLEFSVLWILFEYIRAHLFTGFPWLLLGFAQIETPMKYLAPIIGVYGLSFLAVLSGCLLTIAWQKRRAYPVIVLILMYILPVGLSYIEWVTIHPKSIPISVVQGNIDEAEKWKPGAYEKTIRHYLALTKTISNNSKIIIWPEGAIPVPYPQASLFLENLGEAMKQRQTTLIAGIPYADHHELYYNALVAVGESQGKYFKHHLVPFGEYVPTDFFRDIMKSLGILIYDTRRGEIDQPLIMINNIPVLPFICYEIAYADILLQSLPNAQLLLTLSDDAWFGRSMARAQHLQIAQMRSLQSGRYQIFATNNGISAVIDAHGNIVDTVPSFETQILNGNIKIASGSTPWSRIGDNMIVLGLMVLLIFCRLYSMMKV